ncbi:MAG: hypothetical protein V4584_04015 [Verrucomicrobiota bacterium]
MRRLFHSFPLKLVVLGSAIIAAVIILHVRSVLGLNHRVTPRITY